MLCRAVPCRAVTCVTVCHRAVLCCAVPCRAVPCRAVPCRAVPCRNVCCHVLSCCGCARSLHPLVLVLQAALMSASLPHPVSAIARGTVVAFRVSKTTFDALVGDATAILKRNPQAYVAYMAAKV